MNNLESNAKKKLVCDSSYDSNHYNVINHLAREYMRKKQKDKKEKVKDEVYYVKKIKEIKSTNNNLYLVVICHEYEGS